MTSEQPRRLSAEEIAKKVAELTKGSAFDQRKEEKRRGIEARVAEMKRRLSATQPAERERVRLLVEKAIEDAENSRDLSKVMVHVDMDAFYASVEIRDQPDLADKPVAVGGNSMLSTCNYIARSYGCRSALPGFVAKKLCPNLIILPPDFKKYTAVARQVRDVFAEYCPDFVTGGLDEAYLDLTEYLESRLLGKVSNKICDFQISENLCTRVGCNCGEIDNSQPVQSSEAIYCQKCKLLKCKVGETITFGDSVWSVVEEIRFKILLATRLTSSAGIASNTMIAKIASDLRKPNGQYMVKSDIDEITRLMETMPVAKVGGIGPVSQGELAGLGIVTCGELRSRLCDIYQVFSELHFGFLLHVSLGMGSTELEQGGPRKSIGTETTFEKTSDIAKLLEIIRELCQEVSESLEEEHLCGRTLTLKLKTSDFRNFTRAGSCPGKNAFFLPANKGQDLFQTAKSLLEKEFSDNNGRLSIRLLGVRVSNLKDLSEIESNNEPSTSISAFLGKIGSKKRKNEDRGDVEICPKRSSDEFVEEISLLDEDLQESNSSNSDVQIVASEAAQPGEETPQTYSCPICNAKLPRMTLSRFNRHIDECLTRSAIRSIKEEEKKLAESRNFTTKPQPAPAEKPHLARTISTGSNNRKSSSPPAMPQGQKSILSFLKPR